jgi:hypothetical protein
MKSVICRASDGNEKHEKPHEPCRPDACVDLWSRAFHVPLF